MGENQVVNHQCPNCGAPLYYNIEGTNWACDFCGNTYSAEQLITPADAQKEFVPTNWEHKTFSQNEDLHAYLCSNCGGRVIAYANTVASFCAFCHSPAIITDRIKDDLKPDLVIPFKVTQEKAMEEFRKILKLKPLLPKMFRESIKNGEITGIYAPFWMFSSNVDFEMKADGEHIVSWTKGDYHYTRTETYYVERCGNVPIDKLPVDASQRLDDKIMDAIEPYDYRELTDFNTHYLTGMFAEAYDVHHNESYDRFYIRSRAALEKLSRESTKKYTNTIVRSFSVTPNDLEVKYGMFPVWTLSINYKGVNYAFAINGQTGKTAGRLPVSMQRLLFLFSAIGAIMGTIIALFQLLLR